MERWKTRVQVDDQTIIKVTGRNAKEMKRRLDEQLNNLNGKRRR